MRTARFLLAVFLVSSAPLSAFAQSYYTYYTSGQPQQMSHSGWNNQMYWCSPAGQNGYYSYSPCYGGGGYGGNHYQLYWCNGYYSYSPCWNYQQYYYYPYQYYYYPYYYDYFDYYDYYDYGGYDYGYGDNYNYNYNGW